MDIKFKFRLKFMNIFQKLKLIVLIFLSYYSTIDNNYYYNNHKRVDPSQHFPQNYMHQSKHAVDIGNQKCILNICVLLEYICLLWNLSTYQHSIDMSSKECKTYHNTSGIGNHRQQYWYYNLLHFVSLKYTY
jgi:hypothetical protein